MTWHERAERKIWQRGFERMAAAEGFLAVREPDSEILRQPEEKSLDILRLVKGRQRLRNEDAVC